MTCIQVPVCHLAINFRSIRHLRTVHSLLCVTPTHISQFPKNYLRLPLRVSTYQQRTTVCLFGNKGKSENTSEDAMEEAMGSLKKEPSVQDLLKQQMEEEEFPDDFFDLQEISDDGGSGGNHPGGGGGGGGGGGDGSGESDNKGGSLDELLQVILATVGLLFVYFYILNSEDVNVYTRDFIKYLLGGQKSIRLKRVLEKVEKSFQRLSENFGVSSQSLTGNFQSLTRKPVTGKPIKSRELEEFDAQEAALQSAIIMQCTDYDYPDKYRRMVREMLRVQKYSITFELKLTESMLWLILWSSLKFRNKAEEDKSEAEAVAGEEDSMAGELMLGDKHSYGELKREIKSEAGKEDFHVEAGEDDSDAEEGEEDSEAEEEDFEFELGEGVTEAEAVELALGIQDKRTPRQIRKYILSLLEEAEEDDFEAEEDDFEHVLGDEVALAKAREEDMIRFTREQQAEEDADEWEQEQALEDGDSDSLSWGDLE